MKTMNTIKIYSKSNTFSISINADWIENGRAVLKEKVRTQIKQTIRFVKCFDGFSSVDCVQSEMARDIRLEHKRRIFSVLN